MPTRTGKERFGSSQRNLLTALWNDFHEDPSKGFTYHINEFNTDNLNELYETHPVFQACDKAYFNSNTRKHATKFNLELETKGVRARASEFSFQHSNILYLIILFLTFLSLSFFY